MGSVLHRLLQAIRFERDAFVWMEFNDRATGDALILVVVTQILLLLGAGSSLLGLVFGITGLISALLQAVVFWLVFSGVVYAAAKYLFNGDGTYAVILRIAGFAYPTLLIWIFTFSVISSGTLAYFAGALWFLAIVAQGTHYVADLPLDRAGLASLLGLIGAFIIQAIFSGGLF